MSLLLAAAKTVCSGCERIDYIRHEIMLSEISQSRIDL